MAGTPFEQEEQGQLDSGRPQWNPWNGPAQPSYFQGLGYDDHGNLGAYDALKKGVLSGVDKGLAVMGSVYRSALDTTATDSEGEVAPESGSEYQAADAFNARMREHIKANTPNANTAGGAAQLLHGIVSGVTEMSAGGLLAGPAGAAAVVGSSEGLNRKAELTEAGVDEDTANKSAALTATTSAIGALLPGGIGSTLVSKIASGAAGNAGIGMLNRYADSRILQAGGYTDMANQQKVIDGTQILTDLILGGGFGFLAHLHSPEIEQLRNAPGARDAALTTNLALKDRDTAPGVPVDPAAANAHQAALEKGIADLMEGRPVDVSDAGVHDAEFLERPEAKDPQAEAAVRESISDNEFFGEGNERAVQDILEGREPEVPTESRVPYEPPAEETTAAANEGEKPEVTQTPPGEEREGAPDDSARILAEKPDLMIPDEETGQPVRAADALARLSEEVSTTKRESSIAAKAAIQCFMRRGG